MSLIPSDDIAAPADYQTAAEMQQIQRVIDSVQPAPKPAAQLAKERLRVKESIRNAKTPERKAAAQAELNVIEDAIVLSDAEPAELNAAAAIRENLAHAAEKGITTPEYTEASASVLSHIAKQTSRYDVSKLLSALSINKDVQLSKRDTADLLASLLTCNESQLQALYTNPKLPLSIKTIIKRIQMDAKTGDTSTIERMWDRLFGKQGLQDQSSSSLLDSASSSDVSSIIPNGPVSREAYIILKETLLK